MEAVCYDFMIGYNGIVFKIRKCDTKAGLSLIPFKLLMPLKIYGGFSSKTHSVLLIIIKLYSSCVFSGSLVTLILTVFPPVLSSDYITSLFYFASQKSGSLSSMFPPLFGLIGLSLFYPMHGKSSLINIHISHDYSRARKHCGKIKHKDISMLIRKSSSLGLISHHNRVPLTVIIPNHELKIETLKPTENGLHVLRIRRNGLI